MKKDEEDEYNEIFQELVEDYRKNREEDFTPYSSHQAEGDKMALAAEARKILAERKVERAKPQWVVEKNGSNYYRVRLRDSFLYYGVGKDLSSEFSIPMLTLDENRACFFRAEYEIKEAIAEYKRFVAWEVVDE